MKIIFSFSDISSLGDKQAQVSEAMIAHLKAKKDFYVQFGADKTPNQLKGFFRICGLLAPYIAESEGTFFDKDMVKELVKQETNFCTAVKGRIITKSLTMAKRAEMQAMITRLYELCEFYEIKDYKLTSAEKKALVEFYETKN